MVKVRRKMELLFVNNFQQYKLNLKTASKNDIITYELHQRYKIKMKYCTIIFIL